MAVSIALPDTIQGLIEMVGPSVVGIRDGSGHGSGIVFAPGQVLTNAHNIRRGSVQVSFSDGRTAEASVTGVDLDGDLAVLSVDTGDAPAIRWRDGDVVIGSPVFAVADPGGRGLRVTVGTVSGVQRAFRGPRGRRITGALEHTAPLLPGSSGGPLVDAEGALLGINTHRLGEGFYLAIAADAGVRARVDALASGTSTPRARLGVALAPAEVARRLRRAVGLAEADGLLVRGVEDGSPAARAGIVQGDLIVRAGGEPVADVDALHDAIASATGSLEIALLRGTEERTVTVAIPS